MGGIGRLTKNKRRNKKVTQPEECASSPTKSASLFGSLISELHLLSKDERIEKVHLGIKSLLAAVFDSDRERKECITSLLANMTNGDAPLDISSPNNASASLNDDARRLPPAVTPVVGSTKSPPVTFVPYDPKAFATGRSWDAARQMKKRRIDTIKAAVDKSGDTESQKLLCLHSYLKKARKDPVVYMALKSIKFGNVSGDVASNLKEVVKAQFVK